MASPLGSTGRSGPSTGSEPYPRTDPLPALEQPSARRRGANPKAELRNPQAVPPSPPGGRRGDPFRISDFGFRLCALATRMAILTHLHGRPERFDFLG